MSNTFDKLSVLDSFIEEVNSYLPEIETNLERLAQSPGDMDALEETYRRTHTIGGSASMMDFPGLSHVAHGMEDILGDALDGIMALDEPALGLLQRSLGRLHQLVEGIRSGIDQEAVIAEDDADYSGYRALIEGSSAQPAQAVPTLAPGFPAYSVYDTQTRDETSSAVGESYSQEPYVSYRPGQDVSVPVSSGSSFDEVLASFRTPVVNDGEEVAWPEEPARATSEGDFSVQSLRADSFMSPSVPPLPSMPSFPSALDTLVASTRQGPAVTPPPISYLPVENEQVYQYESSAPSYNAYESPAPSYNAYESQAPAPSYNAYESQVPALLPAQDVSLTVPIEAFAQAYEDAQKGTQNLGVQASSLKHLLTQLRSSMSIIEMQRSEFKGFLDGSKDALDRMEEWAGQAMGLNLRNSPEQVRRYLPLSVMWVANSKLKKVLDLLNQITGGTEMTEEQINIALQQLHASLSSCDEAFQQVQSAQVVTQAQAQAQTPGWTSWDMQVAHDQEALRERVTFERYGDPAALRAEIETQLREEIRREYDSSALLSNMRAEMEQQIRNEVRQEFEAQRNVQESVLNSGNYDLSPDVVARLRNEIEIQVRQDFLSQITSNERDLSLQRESAARDQAAPAVSNFLDHASEATTGHLGPVNLSPSALSLPVSPRPSVSKMLPPVATPKATSSAAPKASSPAPAPRNAPLSSFASDLGEEAAEIFRAEAEEHLQTISVHVAALEKAPEDLELIQGIRRATHTLKGAAGMMGFRAIADLSHVSEDLLDSIMEGTTSISSAALSLIFDTAELLDTLIAGQDSDLAASEVKVEVLRARYLELLGEYSSPPLHGHADEYIDAETDSNEEALSGTVVGGGQSIETNAQRATRGDLSVRVRLQKLDELVNLFGELLVNRSVLEERIQRLVRLVSDVGVSSNRLRDVGQKLESRFEAATLPSGRSVQVMPGEGTQSLVASNNETKSKNGRPRMEMSYLAEFDELELDRYTEFHQLARGLSEGISDMTTLSTEMDAIIRECENIFSRENRLNATFQDRLMKVRLVPLSSMTPRLYRAGRAVALKQGKDFDFLLEGEETEVDRTVFEEIAGPLLHLIRNAVNHAIETPEKRVQRGKAPIGQLKLTAAYEGNQVVITVSDDGTGIDLEHVRDTAIQRGLIRSDQALNEGDVLDLIFLSGFSTAEVLSEESGRGVGLDVVRDSVSRLRGTLVVDSTPGHGTSFIMKFPTSLAIQSAMMVRTGGQQFAIPTVMVESIGRLDNFKRTTVFGQPSVLVRNETYLLNTLAQYLSLPAPLIDEKSQVLLVNAGGQRVALVVDEIKSKQDIVTKNLGPHLRHVHGVAGGTVLGNGRVVLILELGELLIPQQKTAETAAPGRREAATYPASVKQRVDVSSGKPGANSGRMGSVATPSSERGKHILVVDDSPSVRRVVSNMLKQHGWEVQMARDGVEALEMISSETPAAVLLDIEMPRMDGYELTATVRAQEQYRTLPLVVLTSRAAAKHQQRAMQLGASAYVVKPYQDEELLNTLNVLVYGAAVR